MPDCDWPIILERISTNRHLLLLDKGSLLLSFLKTVDGLGFFTRGGRNCLRADVSSFLCCTRKRDVCVTPSLIVFQQGILFRINCEIISG